MFLSQGCLNETVGSSFLSSVAALTLLGVLDEVSLISAYKKGVSTNMLSGDILLSA